MKKKKWSRVLPVLLVMVTVISLLPGCGRKRAEKKMQKQSRCIYGAQTCMKICTIHPETAPGYPG